MKKQLLWYLLLAGSVLIIIVSLALLARNTEPDTIQSSAENELISAAVTDPDNFPESSEDIETESTDEAADNATFVGTYRCWQYLVDGATSLTGCRLQTPFVFAEDGTYTFSTESGTYKISGNEITLSESQYRGTGEIREGGVQLYFKYMYQGKEYEVTYLKQGI